MIARLDPAIFERELPVPALPVWEPLPETLGGAEERRWGLRDDGSLAAEYDGAQGRMVFASELTPAEQVSFLFSLIFLLFVLTFFFFFSEGEADEQVRYADVDCRSGRTGSAGYNRDRTDGRSR